MTDAIKKAIAKSFVLLNLSLNMQYAATSTYTELRAIIAPTIPPFKPAFNASLYEIT